MDKFDLLEEKKENDFWNSDIDDNYITMLEGFARLKENLALLKKLEND